MSSLQLLGPQWPSPNAPEVLESAAGDGPIVTITAGWRHAETDDEALRRHLGPDVAVLPIYRWFEVVMDELPDLRRAYRGRQAGIVELARLHRIRLGAAASAAHALLGEARGPHVDAQTRAAIDDVRRVDSQLLQAIAAVHARVAADSGTIWQHPVVQRLRERGGQALRDAGAIVVTGGHVGVLRNRMAFFGLPDHLRVAVSSGVPLLAWSAGAMVLTERVVLFYDDPPEGPSIPEVLDAGFGVVPSVVLFPHARRRLALERTARVQLLAARFAPSLCIGLENGAWIVRDPHGAWINRGESGTAVRLGADGHVTDLPVAR